MKKFARNPIFPIIELPHLKQVILPPLLRVRLQHPRSTPISDVQGAVHLALDVSRRLGKLPKGARVALAVGSRGIADLAQVVAATIANLKRNSFDPFIVPAMGSHGGGTAEGQVQVLAKLGVTETAVGAPIHATMEVVDYAATAEGIPCKFDRYAAEADAIVVINRIKSHTSFDRQVESGLVKMVAAGLGKVEGAANIHILGPRGLSEVLPELARIAIAKSPIAYGIALVENADKKLVCVEGVESEDFFAADERLLKLAKSLLPRLPFNQIDALVVELIGKEISGAGMDYAVTGRTDIRGVPNPPRPFIHKIAVLGVTPESAGNGQGIGLADYTTRQVVESLDLQAMYMNAVISTNSEKARIPIVLPNDLAAINASVATCRRIDPENARLCVIRSTHHLNEILVSPTLFADLEGQDGFEMLSKPIPLEFSNDHRLLTRC